MTDNPTEADSNSRPASLAPGFDLVFGPSSSLPGRVIIGATPKNLLMGPSMALPARILSPAMETEQGG